MAKNQLNTLTISGTTLDTISKSCLLQQNTHHLKSKYQIINMLLDSNNEAKMTVKVNHYLQAKVFKQTTATKYGTEYCSYGFKWGDAIHSEHLLALVLYA
eukprot:194340_1